MRFEELTRRGALVSGLAALAGCDQNEARDPAQETGTLEWAAAGPWRIDPERDAWQHPVETLRFWGLAPGQTVLEILPGRGWLTAILAPYLAHASGHLIVATFDPQDASPARRETMAAFDARFSDKARYGEIARSIVLPGAAPLAPPESVDLAILANNLHTLMAEGVAERVFSQVMEALKPGGVFGVEQHRAAASSVADPSASTGYVQEAYVKKLAEEAGFEFVAATDINANPRDTRDHPFGVWTLPPILATAPLGQPANPDFDTAPYQQIGESDRMTLKFRKRTRK